MVRVTYQFKNNQLLRSESVINLQNPSQITKTQPIVVADNISNMVCSFLYTSSTQKDGTIEESPTWDSNQFFAALDTRKKGDNKSQKIEIPKMPPLPSAIKVRITLFDRLKIRQHSYSTIIPIPTAPFTHDAGVMVLQPPLPQQKQNPLAQIKQGAVPQILVRTPQRAKQFQDLSLAAAKHIGMPQR